jgi:glycosyltransferase involved in cell wall biosynthesis
LYDELKVTIGVCVKNCEHLIEETIKSISEQDFPHILIEVIFVDDGSEDKTVSIIQSYVPKLDIQTKVFNHEWQGLGPTRNVVVDNAKGEYIVWVDGDMLLSKDFVTKQVEFMDRNPQVGIGKGKYGMYPQESLAGTLENMEFVVTTSTLRRKGDVLPLGTGGSIYRTQAIRQVSGFDNSIKGSGEDMDAQHRISLAGWKLDFTPAVFYERRRENWKSLWREYFWHGRGSSRLLGKEKQVLDVRRFWPPLAFATEVFRLVIAYRLTSDKVALLLPLQYVFKRTAWLLGLLGSYMERTHSNNN